MTRIVAAVLALALAGPALAQESETPEPLNIPESSARADGLFRSEDLAEATLYRMGRQANYDWSSDAPPAIDDDWEEIGEVEDIVLDESGALAGVLVEVGGFLGLGEKSILIPLEEIKLVRGEDERVAYVTRFGEDLLEEWPAIEDEYWE